MRHIQRGLVGLFLLLLLSACASLPNREPLNIDVAGIESLPGEGMELRLAVKIRIQNPNNVDIEYDGVALTLDLNDRQLGSGVSSQVGVVPRYGESVFTVPVTISAFDMINQLFGAIERRGDPNREVSYRVRGKLEGGLFGTRRFEASGQFELPKRR
ncbi:MAG: LEA type 2 family protein [Lysobacteraceae bacterium]|nr:LEA type 2 family protein [Xanthomonadales bacterium]HPF74740.1 LEA type 2 family protein [Xanthomonadaceae bacterium]HRY01156.1 LEA type 2 family protein [Xanthomonadaceae bacterium]